MRIECPDCNAAYEVPEAQIRPGRSVRCVRCEGQWRPAGELPKPIATLPAVEDGPDVAAPDQAVRDGVVRLRQSAAPAPLVPAGGVAVDHAASPRLPGLLLTAWGGWAASLVLLGLLLVSAIHWRGTIMQGWPPSIRLYTALGATPPPPPV